MREGIRRSESVSVSFEQVSKHFGEVVAVDKLDLTIEAGEFMVLLGPSGCGKTTSLRMVAGLETVTAGTIRIGEDIVNEVPPRGRNVAMVFQSYALYPHMRVFDNIGYPLKIRKLSKAAIREQVMRAAEILQIPHLTDRLPRELSGGERQRVALARAIVREPNVFLFDEPLSNLDAELRLAMRGELKYLHKQLGATAVHVTHDQAEAMAMADRIAVMRDGRLQQLGSPREVYDHPTNTFVGHFVGSPGMNLISGHLEARDGALYVRSEQFAWVLPEGLAIGLRAQGQDRTQVVLGVRPEDFQLSNTDEQGYALAKIFAVEPVGYEVLVDIMIGEHIRVAARTGVGFEGQAGERVWVRADPARLRVFDATSQDAIG